MRADVLAQQSMWFHHNVPFRPDWEAVLPRSSQPGDVFTAPPGRPVQRGQVLAREAGKYAAVTLLRTVLSGYKSNPTWRHMGLSAPASAADAALSLRW